jgi:hypothetical protein
MAIVRHYLAFDDTRISPRQLPHVALTMTLTEMETFHGHYHDGSGADRATMGRLLCDSVISRIIHDQGIVLDHGRGIRTVPDPLRRVVIERDRHCRFPGCDRPPQWCDAHHNQHWTKGGITALHNLVLLCNRHHHLFHKPGWTSTLEPDGTFTVTNPHGRVTQTKPPPAGGP